MAKHQAFNLHKLSAITAPIGNTINDLMRNVLFSNFDYNTYGNAENQESTFAFKNRWN